MDFMKFKDFFHQATGFDPYPYQVEFADQWGDVLEVPTGCGKTEAIVLGWLWRRRHHPCEGTRQRTPRRLVYCLPMRVLVEQTFERVQEWLKRLDLAKQVQVWISMGGESDDDWDTYPEREQILIGTQDMLLSRALNRGYAMSRYRWPVQFGLLNNDCQWVFDEVQLMGNGLATSAQLAAFRKQFGVWGECPTLWVSATFDPNWLRTVDFRPYVSGLRRCTLSNSDRANPDISRRLKARKRVSKSRAKAGELDKLANEVIKKHRPGSLTLVVVNTVARAIGLYKKLTAALKQGSASSGRAQQPSLPVSSTPIEVLLLHSRFRPCDREAKLERLRRMAQEGGGGIVVSTQVIEAGVDISARVLFTELCPWPSFVQRAGRCNRYGKSDNAEVIWVDVEGSDAPPYELNEIEITRTLVASLADASPDSIIKLLSSRRLLSSRKLLSIRKPLSIRKRPSIRKLLSIRKPLSTINIKLLSRLSPEQRSRLNRLEPTHVLRAHDLHSLFSTEADLHRGYTDVSHFVRNAEAETDVYVFWRKFESKSVPGLQPAPAREELCPVRLYRLREFLERNKGRAWLWNAETRCWESISAMELRAGMTVMLPVEQGGYSEEVGWTGNSADTLDADKLEPAARDREAPDSLQDEPGSEGKQWVALTDHLIDAEKEAEQLVQVLNPVLCSDPCWKPCARCLVLGARWHDVGKAMKRWQEAGLSVVKQVLERLKAHTQDMLRWIEELTEQLSRAEGSPQAKFPSQAQLVQQVRLSTDVTKRLLVPFLPGLRHEAASALVAWEKWRKREVRWSALAVYLIACHHGKVRTVLRSIEFGKPRSQLEDVFGLKPGDQVPRIPGWFEEDARISLAPKTFGMPGRWEKDEYVAEDEGSWAQMSAELLGPKPPDKQMAYVLTSPDEPRALGPFRLAYLEALIRAADVNASRYPGRYRARDGNSS